MKQKTPTGDPYLDPNSGRSLGKAITSSVIIAVLGASLVFGAHLRDQIDLKGRVVAPSGLLGMTASADEKVVTVPLGPYYEQIKSLLGQFFVDPIQSDQALALGSIRGMIGYLNDPNSRFMDGDAYQAFLGAQEGKYQGVGITLQLTYGRGSAPDLASAVPEDFDGGGSAELPNLVVTSVAPGSSAEKAGVKVGDIVDSIDGHIVISQALIDEMRRLRSAPQSDILAQRQLSNLRAKLIDSLDDTLAPNRAYRLLTTGASGSLDAVWRRGQTKLETKLSRAETDTLVNQPASGNLLRLRLCPGADKILKDALENRTELTIDLRNSAQGNFSTMVDCLSLLAPTGHYGSFETKKSKIGEPFDIKGAGKANSVKLRLIVDDSTTNAASIFAVALGAKGLATLEGPNPMLEGPMSRVKVQKLPDGSAYSLSTGIYEAPKDAVWNKGKAS